MSAEIDSVTLEQFRARLAERTGLTFSAHQQDDLLEALRERSSARRLSPAKYVEALRTSEDEPAELARTVTINETYFFRHPAQLEACVEAAVPAILTRRPDRPIRILSAACATGDEPYSLAILLRERYPGQPFSIVGVDLSPRVLDHARRATYSAWSLRETSPALRARWFREHADLFELDPSIREAVRFEPLNLADSNPKLLAAGSFDVVFCRNVLMYFTPERCAEAIGRLTRALAPGGFLFLGHAETLRGVSHDFHLRHTHEAFYYQLKGQDSLRAPRSDWESQSELDASAAGQRRPRETGSRAQLATPPLPTPPQRTAAATVPRPEHVLAHAREPARGTEARTAKLLDLLHKEQFTQALDVMRDAPSQPEARADDLLLEAVISAHAGRFDSARELCRRLLETDELNAGAQYVLALCHEADGDSDRAIHHNQLSAYLDPGFAMPRVHLGLLLRRLGQVDAARRELREARTLLEREDPARLLMFGGGWNRAALLELCRQEAGVDR